MNPSTACFDLFKSSEGYARALPDGRCQAYPDPGSGGDPWTIGFGSTGHGIVKGTVWTRQEAETRLEADVIRFAAQVASAVNGGAATSQNEFDAMVSLAYNIGFGNFSGSTVLRKHRSGDKTGAASAFAAWNRAAGHVMPGLVKRRAAEAAMYRGAQ
jgi:GH24 family phage-related lysozyme (muramidase)